jgi:hypothetical protein
MHSLNTKSAISIERRRPLSPVRSSERKKRAAVFRSLGVQCAVRSPPLLECVSFQEHRRTLALRYIRKSNKIAAAHTHVKNNQAILFL